MKDEEMRRLFSGIMDLMVQARWLHSYTFTDGKGFHLTWTENGSMVVVALKLLIDSYSLDESDMAPLTFDKLAHGEALPPGMSFLGELPPEVAKAWRSAISELGIDRSEDFLLGLVHIIHEWAPDDDADARFRSD